MNKVNALLMAIGLVAAATYIYKVELSTVNPTGKRAA